MIITKDIPISVVNLKNNSQFFSPTQGWLIKSERIENLLFEMLEDPVQEFSFKSYSDLYQVITSNSIKQALSNSIKQFHKALIDVSIEIEMTGDYISDFLATASQVKNLEFNSKGCIDGYAWHHVEGSKDLRTTPKCKMQLLTTECHRTPHSGAVSQYRQAFGAFSRSF